MKSIFLSTVLAMIALPLFADEKKEEPKKPVEIPAKGLVMVVMDPLAAPLSCPCVQGYAQRDYEKLAKHLEAKLGRPVKVHFAESLTAALEQKTEGKADLIIGKFSVVADEGKTNKLNQTPLA